MKAEGDREEVVVEAFQVPISTKTSRETGTLMACLQLQQKLLYVMMVEPADWIVMVESPHDVVLVQ